MAPRDDGTAEQQTRSALPLEKRRSTSADHADCFAGPIPEVFGVILGCDFGIDGKSPQRKRTQLAKNNSTRKTIRREKIAVGQKVVPIGGKSLNFSEIRNSKRTSRLRRGQKGVLWLEREHP